MHRQRQRTVQRIVILTGLGAVFCAGLMAPAVTRQGINYQVSTHSIPFYVKAVDFLHRHYQYQILANDITRGCHSDQERVSAVFAWTREHIHPTPKGWPVVDDHILHIIIRGYGGDDQMADVFTTLSTYAGMPAFWRILKTPGTRRCLILSFARVQGKWAVFDVANGFVFRNSAGELATPEELAADSRLVIATTGPVQVGDGPYERYFVDLARVKASRPLRAELQMPGPRLWHEVRRVIGLEG